jgi:hypothetical protein
MRRGRCNLMQLAGEELNERCDTLPSGSSSLQQRDDLLLLWFHELYRLIWRTIWYTILIKACNAQIRPPLIIPNRNASARFPLA